VPPPVRRWEDNIKTNLREIEWGGMDGIDLARDGDHWWALLNTILNLQVCINVGKLLGNYKTGGFSRMGHDHRVSHSFRFKH
jgi:hypothetical protein